MTMVVLLFYFSAGNCYSYQFSCDNGDCVPDSYRCNDFDDCGDNSDEDGCGMVYYIWRVASTCNEKH